MEFDPSKPLKRVNGQIVPQVWDSVANDWVVLQGVGGAYRVQNAIDVSEEYFEGNGDLTKEFSKEMIGLVISNDSEPGTGGAASLSFTIHGVSRTVKAGEVYEGKFKPFTLITITSSVPWRAEALQSYYGASIDVPPPEDTTAPDDVTGLKTSNVTATSLTLSWVASASNDCIGYDIYRGSTLIGSVAGTVFNVTGLTQNTQYTFTVKAKDAVNNISIGTSITVTTEESVDTIPPIITASPAGGAYNAAQTVTLTANEPTTIYYTIDGSTPTMDSAVYLAPIAINLTATLKYFGRDTAGNISNVQTQDYLINIPDTTPPIITANPPGGTYPDAQLITLLANEPAAIYYTTDGSIPSMSSAVYSSPIQINESKTIKFIGKDTAGNVSSVQSAVYTIGTVPGYVNDSSLLLYQDKPAINQTIANKDIYFHGNEQFTAFVTVKLVPGASNAAAEFFSRSTPNAVLFGFTWQNKFRCTLTGKTGATTSFPQAVDPTVYSDFSAYYHVVIVRDSSKLYLYVNNNLVANLGVGSDFIIDDSTSPLLFGSTNNTPIFKNMGYYNRALSAAELTQNYNALK
ncbi:hypothetical protein GCM10023310_01070 [Paenibacillus vulneris]|uniref:Chitobiase/beta-hexosaminidase C-terminal domain-containing protein n=1 Tax=Paenibacillus vulneris TaxID=1133364 RepID=A0ABW3V0X9_9BACL